MKKNCENCFARSESYELEYPAYCNKYDCFCDEVAKELENPSCWEDNPED